MGGFGYNMRLGRARVAKLLKTVSMLTNCRHMSCDQDEDSPCNYPSHAPRCAGAEWLQSAPWDCPARLRAPELAAQP